MSVQRYDLPAPRVERTFTAIRAALPAESVSAFESQLAEIAHADTVDLPALDRFLTTWHGIASRFAADPEDWALMHREAAEIEAGTRPLGPPLAEVLARRGGRR
jgi:Family of unknown function (DUF6247)